MDVRLISIVAIMLLFLIVMSRQCGRSVDQHYSRRAEKAETSSEPERRIITRIVDFDERRRMAGSMSTTATGSGPSLPPSPITFSDSEIAFFDQVERLNNNPRLRRARELRENGQIDQAIAELIRLIEENPHDSGIQFLANSELMANYQIQRNAAMIRESFRNMMTHSRVFLDDMSYSESQSQTQQMLSGIDAAREHLGKALGDPEMQQQLQGLGVNPEHDDNREQMLRLMNALP